MTQQKENALGLVPNEVVGWRIRTDEYNYTIVLVKRHGAASKDAGKTYETPLGYHKSLEAAIPSLIDRAVRGRAEGIVPPGDDESFLPNLELLLKAIQAAKADALEAVAQIKKRS